ncbi:MAG: CooT family nickel-binding protein [Chloroflexota bacterium]|nr:CooT family nickel-binding protein [Chloroflexota bacterium]
MCEANVFLIADGSEQEIMKEVLSLEIDGTRVIMGDLLGNHKDVQAKVKSINFINHKVILEQA